MANTTPILTKPYQTSVYERDEYIIRVLFGSAVITSYRSLAATIVRNSAGNYTVTLPTTYEELTDFDGSYLLCAAGVVYFAVVKTSTVTTNGQFVFEIRTEAGTATDPAAGDKMSFVIGASLSPLNSKFAVTV